MSDGMNQIYIYTHIRLLLQHRRRASVTRLLDDDKKAVPAHSSTAAGDIDSAMHPPAAYWRLPVTYGFWGVKD
jgi:hypothetical protein